MCPATEKCLLKAEQISMGSTRVEVSEITEVGIEIVLPLKDLNDFQKSLGFEEELESILRW